MSLSLRTPMSLTVAHALIQNLRNWLISGWIKNPNSKIQTNESVSNRAQHKYRIWFVLLYFRLWVLYESNSNSNEYPKNSYDIRFLEDEIDCPKDEPKNFYCHRRWNSKKHYKLSGEDWLTWTKPPCEMDNVADWVLLEEHLHL